MPISLTVHGNLLYVLNAGGSGNITGFTVDRGQLTPLAGSTQPLSNGGVGSAPGPAQISFTPDGQQLVVTEKASNSILTYAIGAGGLASAPTVHPSAGMTPFGFAFNRRGYLIVSEAFGGAPDASAASSYALGGSDLQVISPSVPTHQTAACWVVVTGNGKYAYTTNTGSGSVSGYQVGRDGSLTLLDADGVTGDTGPGSMPTDAALSVGSRYLYVLNSGTHTVAAFQVNGDGSLAPLGEVSIPAGAVGIAAR
jgi:6-phosphogluconolactonase (cycloisomerase 2 family)